MKTLTGNTDFMSKELRPDRLIQTLIDSAVAALDAGDPDKAICILKAADVLCNNPETCRLIQRAIEQADCGTCQEAENILTCLIEDGKPVMPWTDDDKRALADVCDALTALVKQEASLGNGQWPCMENARRALADAKK